MTVSSNVTQDDLYAFSTYLTEELCGYAMYEIKDIIFDRLRKENATGTNKDMALDIAQLAISDYEEPRLHMDGIENLLKIPEMVEEERLNSLLSIIEEKNILRRILEKAIEIEGIRTLIGEEIEEEKVKGCSMVSSLVQNREQAGRRRRRHRPDENGLREGRAAGGLYRQGRHGAADQDVEINSVDVGIYDFGAYDG